MIDVVCAVIINDKSEFLLSRRSQKRDIGKWEFPGGKTMQGEELQAATEREIKEELGIFIKAYETIHMLEHGPFRLHFIKCAMTSNDQSFDLKEHDKIEFFSLTNTPLGQLTDADRDFVNLYLRDS
jgi:mutator protein MutT